MNFSFRWKYLDFFFFARQKWPKIKKERPKIKTPCYTPGALPLFKNFYFYNSSSLVIDHSKKISAKMLKSALAKIFFIKIYEVFCVVRTASGESLGELLEGRVDGFDLLLHFQKRKVTERIVLAPTPSNNTAI